VGTVHVVVPVFLKYTTQSPFESTVTVTFVESATVDWHSPVPTVAARTTEVAVVRTKPPAMSPAVRIETDLRAIGT
jgi:hypothetical protein